MDELGKESISAKLFGIERQKMIDSKGSTYYSGDFFNRTFIYEEFWHGERRFIKWIESPYKVPRENTVLQRQ